MTRGPEPQDPVKCIADTISAAEQHCAAHGLRLTAVRRQVLEMLLREPVALGAYEILERLRQAGLNSQPPAAYRALDFLVSNGLAHKVERLNAFIACSYPGTAHSPAFMICRNCDAVAETSSHAVEGTLLETASAAGFTIERTVVETEGLCSTCQDNEFQ